MKLLFAILVCVVFEVIGEEKKDYSCIPIKGYNEFEWPSEDKMWALMPSTLGKNTTLTTAAELKNAIETSQDGLILTLHQKYTGRPGPCYLTYAVYGLNSLMNYPKLNMLEVYCPDAPVCAGLNLTTAQSFDYYFQGEHKGRLEQGLGVNEYLQKNREVFGEPAAN